MSFGSIGRDRDIRKTHSWCRKRLHVLWLRGGNESVGSRIDMVSRPTIVGCCHCVCARANARPVQIVCVFELPGVGETSGLRAEMSNLDCRSMCFELTAQPVALVWPVRAVPFAP